MKLACAVVSALAVIPTSLAFAPTTSRTALRSETSLDGWFQDLFSGRSEDEEAEKIAIAEQFVKNPILGDLKKLKDPTPEEEEAFEKVTLKGDGDFKHMPTKEQTGVDVHITRLAATLSQQLYDVKNQKKSEFMLNTDKHKTEVIHLETQSVFTETSPTFGAIVSGDTMILGWRGTNTLTDAINDLAWSPCSNVAWRKHKNNLKVQGAMTSLCLNDIANHEDMIIEECKKRGIKEIVTTGHSLGGGLGQIGHTIIRAQIEDETSPWSELEGISVRSVLFCAPMTTVILKDNCSKETEAFIDELNDNSCNIVFRNDVVPRAYGYLSFINAFVDDLTDNLGSYLMDGKPIPSRLIKRKINQIAETQVDNFTESDSFQRLVGALSNYVHPGKLVFYQDENSVPKTLVDMGAFDKNAGKKGTFRSIKYTTKKGTDPIAEVFECHMVPKEGIAYNDEYLYDDKGVSAAKVEVEA